MDHLLFFIENFISKNRQERWVLLSSGAWGKCSSKLDKIADHLNDHCYRFEKNITTEFDNIINNKNIKDGFYFDRFCFDKLLSPITFDDLYEDSILICPKENISFYFHHDGWMWYCCI